MNIKSALPGLLICLSGVGCEEQTVPLGGRCTVSLQCQSELYCEDRVQGGLCTAKCSEDKACPHRGICEPVELDDAEEALCLVACKTPLCRQGFWCAQGEQGEPVCKPYSGRVGGACSNDDDCRADLSCETQPPGGYCSRDCTPCPQECQDGSQPCPPGCIRPGEPLCPDSAPCVKIAFDSTSATALRCLTPCDEDTQCRPDYQCKEVPNTRTSVCLP